MMIVMISKPKVINSFDVNGIIGKIVNKLYNSNPSANLISEYFFETIHSEMY